jgi:hypothetical protein
MKTTIAILLVGFCFAFANGQTLIEKSIITKAGQMLEINFDYPKLIKVTTWDKNEVFAQASVSINGGANDSSFELITKMVGNTIEIKNVLKDFENIPRRITIKRNGEKIIFKNKAEWRAYNKTNNAGGYDMMNEGVDLEIVITIKVPIGMETYIHSVYGMVEVYNFKGKLTVEATYGGTDVSIDEKAIGQLMASTNYGEIFTNLEKKFDLSKIQEENFHTEISAILGKRPTYKVQSQYGKVYLRKEVIN